MPLMPSEAIKSEAVCPTGSSSTLCLCSIKIGEAIKSLKPELLATEPGVLWAEASGMRDWLTHHYFDTSLAIIEATVTEDLPKVEDAVRRLRLRANGPSWTELRGRHPLGYGREIYFWTLLVALAVLIAGALFSLREGIEELIHPSLTSRFAVAYVVLAISAVFDLISFRQSSGQMRNRARRRNVSFLSESQTTSDPSLRTVFLQDAVSVLGDVVALVGLGLNQITGSSIPQGIVAVLIGLLLIQAGFRLVQRSHDFLVGAWLLPTPQGPRRWVLPPVTRPLQPSEGEALRTFLLRHLEWQPLASSSSRSSAQAEFGWSPTLRSTTTYAEIRSPHSFATLIRA
jgi:hypothetical protein